MKAHLLHSLAETCLLIFALPPHITVAGMWAMLNMFVEMNCHPITAREHTFNLCNYVDNLFINWKETGFRHNIVYLHLGKDANQNIF